MEKGKVEQEKKLTSASINEGVHFQQDGEGSEGCLNASYTTKNIDYAAILCDIGMHLYIKYIYIPDWHIHNTYIHQHLY